MRCHETLLDSNDRQASSLRTCVIGKVVREARQLRTEMLGLDHEEVLDSDEDLDWCVELDGGCDSSLDLPWMADGSSDDDDDDSIRYEDNMAAYIEIDSIREILKSEMGALFQDILPSIVDHRPESERDYLKETLKIDMRQLLDQVFATRRTTHATFDEEEEDSKPPSSATRKTATETPRRQKNSGLDESSA